MRPDDYTPSINKFYIQRNNKHFGPPSHTKQVINLYDFGELNQLLLYMKAQCVRVVQIIVRFHEYDHTGT